MKIELCGKTFHTTKMEAIKILHAALCARNAQLEKADRNNATLAADAARLRARVHALESARVRTLENRRKSKGQPK